VLGTRALTAPNGFLNLDLVLATSSFDLHIVGLNVLELHRLHLDDHRTAIDSPLVEGFLEFLAVQLD